MWNFQELILVYITHFVYKYIVSAVVVASDVCLSDNNKSKELLIHTMMVVENEIKVNEMK